MSIFEQIKQIAPDAEVQEGVLILNTVSGEDFAKIANIWNGNINVKNVTGEFNFLDMPKNSFFNVGKVGKININLVEKDCHNPSPK